LIVLGRRAEPAALALKACLRQPVGRPAAARAADAGPGGPLAARAGL